jgi:hypothetical protein
MNIITIESRTIITTEMVPESPRNGRHNKIAITVIFQEEQEENQV